MAEAKLMQEIAEPQAEINRLREQLSSGMHTVHKVLSIMSLVPKCSGGIERDTTGRVSRKHRQGSTFRKVAR